eukprot:sb/3474546/
MVYKKCLSYRYRRDTFYKLRLEILNLSERLQAGYTFQISSQSGERERCYSLLKSGFSGQTPIKRINAFLAALFGGEGGMATFALASAVINISCREAKTTTSFYHWFERGQLDTSGMYAVLLWPCLEPASVYTCLQE